MGLMGGPADALGGEMGRGCMVHLSLTFFVCLSFQTSDCTLGLFIGLEFKNQRHFPLEINHQNGSQRVSPHGGRGGGIK